MLLLLLQHCWQADKRQSDTLMLCTLLPLLLTGTTLQPMLKVLVLLLLLPSYRGCSVAAADEARCCALPVVLHCCCS
jgi:hypothetical protein